MGYDLSDVSTMVPWEASIAQYKNGQTFLGEGRVMMQSMKKSQRRTLQVMSEKEKEVLNEKKKRILLADKELQKNINADNIPIKFRRFSQQNHTWISLDYADKIELKFPRLPNVAPPRRKMADIDVARKTPVALTLPPLYKQHVFQPRRNHNIKRRQKEIFIPLTEVCKSRYLRIPKQYDPYSDS